MAEVAQVRLHVLCYVELLDDIVVTPSHDIRSKVAFSTVIWRRKYRDNRGLLFTTKEVMLLVALADTLVSPDDLLQALSFKQVSYGLFAKEDAAGPL